MMGKLGTVAAVRIGRAVTQPWGPRGVPSAAIKHPATGEVAVGRLGIEGDEQADTVNHGGPEKAILVFARHHYDDWRAVGVDLPDGGFFENLTLDVPGTDERTVVLGETWRIGGVVDVALDCDGDTILLTVEQTGAACHTGNRTCFFTHVEPVGDLS